MKKTIAIELDEDVFNTLQKFPQALRDEYVEAVIVRDINEGVEQAMYERVQAAKQNMMGSVKDGEGSRG